MSETIAKTDGNLSYQTEIVPTSSLKSHPRNYRRHPDDQLNHIAASLSEHGQYRNVVTARDLTILAGHGVWEAAVKKLGWKEITIIRLDVEPSSPAALKVLTGDNEMGRLAETDPLMLAQHLGAIAELDDLLGTGFDTLALDFLRASLAAAEPPVRDPDKVSAPLRGEPKSRRGDVYELGRHRLMCGDSTSAADVDRLMAGRKAAALFTDPPYNVAYDPEARESYFSPERLAAPLGEIANDEMSDDEYAAFLAAMLATAYEALDGGGAVYICHADTQGLAVRQAFLNSGLRLASCIIWKKSVLVFGRADYHWMHEPILYGWKPTASHRWYGDRKQTTVWEVPTDHYTGGSYVHPTQKPVALVQRALENSTAPGDAVLDLFGGSGSTLIAAETIVRIAYLMELDPAYCDVIRQRYADFTDQPQYAP